MKNQRVKIHLTRNHREREEGTEKNVRQEILMRKILP